MPFQKKNFSPRESQKCDRDNKTSKTTENSLEVYFRFAFCAGARAPFSVLENRARAFVVAALVHDEAAGEKIEIFNIITKIIFRVFPDESRAAFVPSIEPPSSAVFKTCRNDLTLLN